MKFKAGNPGRPKGASNKRSIIRKSLLSAFPDGEEGFWAAVAKQAAEGDSSSMAMIANRLIPQLKSETPAFEMELVDGDILSVAAQAVAQCAQGEITPDQLSVFINSLFNTLKIKESTELEARITQLEQKR